MIGIAEIVAFSIVVATIGCDIAVVTTDAMITYVALAFAIITIARDITRIVTLVSTMHCC